MFKTFRRARSLVRIIFLWMLDSLIKIFISGRSTNRSKRKLLLLRLDAIGDFILWLDAVPAYSQLYPEEDWDIYLLCNQECAVLAQTQTRFKLIFLNRVTFVNNWRYRLSLLKRIRIEAFDVLIETVHSREFQYGDSIARISGATERIAPVGDNENQHPFLKRISDLYYNRILNSGPGEEMELIRNAAFVRSLGCEAFRASIPRLNVKGSDMTVPIPERPYFVLFPGARHALRRWSPENFAHIANRLHNEFGLRGAICGSQGERTFANLIIEAMPHHVPILNLCGETSLLELGNVISQARLLITNETVACHLAAATGTDAVVITGGGHFRRFVPYKLELPQKQTPTVVFEKMDCYYCGWRCRFNPAPESPAPCIERVSVDLVWSKIGELLRN